VLGEATFLTCDQTTHFACRQSCSVPLSRNSQSNRYRFFSKIAHLLNPAKQRLLSQILELEILGPRIKVHDIPPLPVWALRVISRLELARLNSIFVAHSVLRPLGKNHWRARSRLLQPTNREAIHCMRHNSPHTTTSQRERIQSLQGRDVAVYDQS